jgi:hypothetical protein
MNAPTESSKAPAGPKELKELTMALRALHKALVKVQRQDYEKEWGAVDAAQLLQLLTRHPQFEWLHELSEFMVAVDELIDEGAVPHSTVRSMYAQARSLVSAQDDTTSNFANRYLALLQSDPALVMEHAALRRVLDRR